MVDGQQSRQNIMHCTYWDPDASFLSFIYKYSKRKLIVAFGWKHRSANNGFVFVVGKRKIISGVIFDVESESENKISLSWQDFEIFEVICSKNGVFRYFWGYVQGRKKFFWFFSQISSFSTTLSLQNELLNSYKRFFVHKDTAISSFDIYPNNLMSIHIDSLVHTILDSKIYLENLCLRVLMVCE